MHKATTLVYVRTDSGVVQVDPGQVIPETTLTDHLEVLTSKGLVREFVEDKAPEGGADHSTPPSGTTSSRTRGRQSGQRS